MSRFIPLSVPNFEGNESKYVSDAFDQGWVSTGGAYITKLEEEKALLEEELGKEEVYTDYVKAMEIQEKLEEVKNKLDEATAKWEELILQNEM